MSSANKLLSYNKTENICFPLIYVAPEGIISIVLQFDTVIDIAVDKTIRIVCFDKFSIASNNKGTKNAILHSNAQIYHDNEKVYSNFFSDIKKTAVIGAQGILFTMDYLKDAYLVSANAVQGTSILSKESIQFLNLDFDFALKLFYTEAKCGENYTDLCNKIVQHAHYEEKEDFLTILINGLNIIQKKNGDIEIKSRPYHITCSPSTGSIYLKTTSIGLGIENSEKGYIKRSSKRVHVSRSGMVITDGYYTTSMDHFGRIISAT